MRNITRDKGNQLSDGGGNMTANGGDGTKFGDDDVTGANATTNLRGLQVLLVAV